jgi:hypothetical protein
MTELYINGYAVILPAGFEFSVVEDNPFLTKSGEYSLEVELDLRNPVNAKIFKHINRFHQKNVSDTLSIILIADNQVRMNGSAVILSHTDTSVEMQLLSGNSNLNYFIGSDKKIDDLDMGMETEITESMALASLGKIYPESNYVCTPVITSAGSTLNKYRYWTEPGNTSETISNIAMMPYLLSYVQKIAEALGYAIEENQLLNNELLCRIYIPNSKKTLQYNEILAEWTIVDFLTEVEKFCNVVFVIDKEKSSIRIVHFYDWNKNSEKIYIDEIIDEYEEEYDSENEIDTVNYEKVKYDLPNDDYHKYRQLDDFVLENVAIEEYDTFQSLSQALNPLSDHYNKYKIYHTKKHVLFGFLEIEADNYYVIQKLADNSYGFVRVNEFRDTGKKDGNTIELKIIPAEMDAYIYPDHAGDISLQAPVIPEETEIEKEDGERGVIDLIESGNTNTDNQSSTISVAIFMGKLNMSGPWSQVDIYATIGNSEILNYTAAWDLILWGQLSPEEKNELVNEFLYYLKFTLRLTGKYGLFENSYSLNKNISSKTIWKISFIPKGKISPQNTFIIRNKEFICVSLETKFNNQGALPVVEGKFYPVD